MPVDTTVEQLLNRTRPAETLHATLTRSYDRAYQVYRAVRQQRTTKTTKKTWESDLRVPYAMQVIDTALVNIVGGKPRAVVKPRRPGDEHAAASMQLALDYYINQDHLAEKQVPFTQQGLIYGLTVAKNQWLYRETERPRRQFTPDPFNPDTMTELPPGTERVILRDGPTFEPWDVYDFWYEPNARDIDSAAYVVLRSWLTADEVKAMARTDTNAFGWDNVEELLRSGQRGVTDTRAQERMLGGGFDKRKNRFEIREYWANDGLTVTGNQQILLRRDANPYWHSQKPVVACSLRPDVFSLQGVSETELIADLQEALWTLQNMRFDNMHLTVQRGITYRESGVADPNALELKPRFRWGVTDHDDVKPFEVGSLPPEAWREDDKMMGQMQLVSGINPYVSGSDLNSVDQNTATGVTALQEVASRLLRFKARSLAFAGYQRSFEQWVDLTKQFLTREMAVRIEGADNTYTWQHLKPQDVIGDYDVTVEGTEESLSRQQERGEVMGLLNALAPFAPLGVINWQPLLEKVAKAFDFSSPQILFAKPEQGGPPAAPLPAGGPPGNGNGAGTQPGLGQQGTQTPQLSPQILQALGQQGGMRLGG